MKGLLLVDKPAGITSHDVVDHVRKASGIRRVGHTGTLDPAATGLLIICLGAATRLSEHLTGLDKVYEGAMRLGVVTDSYDMDGKVLEQNPVPEALSADVIDEAMAEFRGEIMQVPPMVSAVKVGGERLYKMARKGETVEREARPVNIKEFSLLGYEPPLVHFRVSCSRGTYVRSLCHDLGQKLGCGGTLDTLRRTAVGKHLVTDAAKLDDLQTPEDVKRRLLPLADALDLPAVVVRPGGRRALTTGGELTGKDLKTDCPVNRGWIQLKSEEGELLALGQVRQGAPNPIVLPRRVFIKARR